MAKYIVQVGSDDEIIQAANINDARKKGGFWKRRNKLVGRLEVRKLNDNVSGMKKADNFFVRVKKYRKEHPRASQQQAMKALKGKKSVSGTKRKVAGTKAVTGTKRKRRVSGVAASAKIIGKRTTVSGIDRAKAIVRDIDRLEAKRARETKRELKDIIQLAINAKHDKLDALKRAYK